MLAEETPSLNIGRIIEAMPPENVKMMFMGWSGVIEMGIRQTYVPVIITAEIELRTRADKTQQLFL